MPTGVYPRTEKHRSQVAGLSKGKFGPESATWKGGHQTTFHGYAWKQFGKAHCELCGLGLRAHYRKYKRRFDMHCIGDFRILRQENWITVCMKCHGKLDSGKNLRFDKTNRRKPRWAKKKKCKFHHRA